MTDNQFEYQVGWKQELIRRSKTDPVWWIENVLGDTLWDKQKDICNTVVNHERIAIPAAFGLGKCVEENELIPLQSGELKKAKDLINKNFYIYSFNEKAAIRELALAQGFDNGKKQVYRLTLKSGRSFIRTCNHPFYAKSSNLEKESIGFKSLITLDINCDKILCPIKDKVQRFHLKKIKRFFNKIIKTEMFKDAPCGFYWDAIESIEYLGVRRTVSISVPKNNTFITGAVEHNTFLGARLCLWFLYNFYPSRIITTAPTQRQVKDLLWSEIRTAHSNARVQLGGEPLSLSLKLNDEQFAVGFSTDDTNIDMFTGYHSPNQLVIFDQAGGLSKMNWEGAEGLMTSMNCKWLALSNTAISDCEFANICMPERQTKHGNWEIIPITAFDSPNVKAGKDIFPGLINAKWIEDRTKAWGKDDPLYKIFVEAQFVPGVQMNVIPYSFLANAYRYDGQMDEDIQIGLDVARNGLDSTVWVARSGERALEIKRLTGNDTMQVAGETIEFMNYVEHKYSKPVSMVKIDVIGIGSGVYDRLSEQNYPVLAINNSEVKIVVDSERYSNVRAEMAWAIRYRFENNKIGLAVVHVLDQDMLNLLKGDLQIMKYKITSSGKIQIVSKEDVKKALGRSPDYWDALVMSFEQPGGGPAAAEFINSALERKYGKQISDEEWLRLLGVNVDPEDITFVDV